MKEPDERANGKGYAGEENGKKLHGGFEIT